MQGSHHNEKQPVRSVSGYTGPGAEILIKASWHLKSSVIRQPIWVKRAPFWLSHIRPTPERGTTRASAAGKPRHLCSTSARNVSQQWQPGGVLGFHGAAVGELLGTCWCVSSTCNSHVGHLLWHGWCMRHGDL